MRLVDGLISMTRGALFHWAASHPFIRSPFIFAVSIVVSVDLHCALHSSIILDYPVRLSATQEDADMTHDDQADSNYA